MRVSGGYCRKAYLILYFTTILDFFLFVHRLDTWEWNMHSCTFSYYLVDDLKYLVNLVCGELCGAFLAQLGFLHWSPQELLHVVIRPWNIHISSDHLLHVVSCVVQSLCKHREPEVQGSILPVSPPVPVQVQVDLNLLPLVLLQVLQVLRLISEDQLPILDFC